MSSFHSGEKYLEECGGWFTSGSSAEGVALEDNWGHPRADWDTMRLYGCRFGVFIPGGHTPCWYASLDYHPEGCHPAYCKLEVINRTSLRHAILNSTQAWHSIAARRCTTRVGGCHWLDTYCIVRLMELNGKTVSGPAGQYGDFEYISALVCSGPHPALERQFLNRSRQQWPPADVIDYILQLPMLLVLVGHKLSKNFKCEARISWSHREIKFMLELSERVRMGYIACKYVLKYFLAVHWGQN